MKINKYNREPMAIALSVQEFAPGVESDLFFHILNQLKTGIHISEDLFKNIEINISANVLRETNYKRIKEAAENITSRKIRFVNEEKEEFRYIVPFPDVTYSKGNIKVILLSTISKEFLELSKGYTQYELETMMQLKSQYSKRLYEILSGKKRMNNGAWENVDIHLLMKIINATTYEGNVGGFMQKVINVAQEELHRVADIGFEYQKIKMGRKVSHMSFYIFDNNVDSQTNEKIKSERDYLSSLSSTERNDLFKRIINEYNFVSKTINDYDRKIKDQILQDTTLLNKFYEIDYKIKQGIYQTTNKEGYILRSLGFL